MAASASSRGDLLNGNYDSAIKSLQRARETAARFAWIAHRPRFCLCSSEPKPLVRPLTTAMRIESFGKALSKSPMTQSHCSIAQLACERAFLYTQAVDDWEQLSARRSAGRMGRARPHKNLDTIRERAEEARGGGGEPLTDAS